MAVRYRFLPFFLIALLPTLITQSAHAIGRRPNERRRNHAATDGPGKNLATKNPAIPVSARAVLAARYSDFEGAQS